MIETPGDRMAAPARPSFLIPSMLSSVSITNDSWGDPTMPDKCLRLLLDEVRAKTLRILNAVPAEHARWAPARLQNTILWHAGHAFVLVEGITMRSLERTPLIPDGWYEMFSSESHPALVPSDRWLPHSLTSSTSSKPNASGCEGSLTN